MNLFETEYLQIALLAALITTVFVSAIAVTFEKYFKEDYKIKLVVLFASIVVTVITIEFDFSNWQRLVTKIIIMISFTVLFYHYLGGKFIRMLFVKIKKMLPGYGEVDNDSQ